MRIVIELDGHATAQVTPTATEAKATFSLADFASPAAPPPEVLARAKQLGAQDAGSARFGAAPGAARIGGAVLVASSYGEIPNRATSSVEQTPSSDEKKPTKRVTKKKAPRRG